MVANNEWNEYDYLEALPPRVRRAINECPIHYNPSSVWRQWKEGYTQRQIIASMKADVLEAFKYHWSLD